MILLCLEYFQALGAVHKWEEKKRVRGVEWWLESTNKEHWEKEKNEEFLDLKGVVGDLRLDSLILVELTHQKDGLEKTTGRFLTERVLNFSPLEQD